MAPANLDALGTQQIPQHPAPREGEFVMQFVDATHDRQICGRYRSGEIVDTPPADPQRLGLPDDR